MSDRSPSPDSSETLWVVDVTAPLPSGRVRLVAAEAAARLNLPDEKLVALLENRIGPVTKPLPKASADRVAEVLDLAGADVAIRTAQPGEGAAPARAPAHDAHPTDTPKRAAASPGTAPPDTAPSDASHSDDAPPRAAARHDGSRTVDADATPPGSRSQEAPASDRSTKDAARVEGRSDAAAAPIGRAGRRPAASDAARDTGRAGGPVESPAESPGESLADSGDDPWRGLVEEEGDEAMLGDWRQRAPSGPSSEPTPAGRPSPGVRGEGERSERASRVAGPADPGRSADSLGAQGAAAGVARAGGHEGLAGAVAEQEARRGADRGDRGTERPGELWVDEDDDADDDAWSYGLRDPFAEAERRERAMRRWVLAVALVLATVVFVALQWAYSVAGPDGRTPPAYEVGLDAYREGAFVSAARAWTPRAEAGDADAMFMLGWMAEYGQGRAWSNAEAAGWYRQAAERDHGPAQLRLADLYVRGLGVDRDAASALRWYLAAAEHGLPRAQREAARSLAAAGDLAEARGWLERAASEDPDARAWLALVEAANDVD